MADAKKSTLALAHSPQYHDLLLYSPHMDDDDGDEHSGPYSSSSSSSSAASSSMDLEQPPNRSKSKHILLRNFIKNYSSERYFEVAFRRCLDTVFRNFLRLFSLPNTLLGAENIWGLKIRRKSDFWRQQRCRGFKSAWENFLVRIFFVGFLASTLKC